MNRLQHRLLVAPVFFGLFCAGVSVAADAPSPAGPAGTQEWFRGQNPPLAPSGAGRVANLNGQGGADFGPGGGAMPPAPPPMAGAPMGRRAPVSDFPDDQVHDWVVANARYANSRAVFHRAEKELDETVRTAQKTFEQSKDYQDAIATERQAYDAYNAQRQKALQSVMTDPKYLAALELRDQTGEQLARLRASHKGELPREVLLSFASLKLQYASDAHAMETAALEKDDGLKDTRRKMVEAASKVSSLRASFDLSVRSNPQILMARRNLEDARVAVITSEAYLNAATIAGAVATDYSYYRHRWDGVAAPVVGWGGYGYGY